MATEQQPRTIRAKFVVNQVTQYAHSSGEEIKLSPVYSSDPNSENKAFWEATPNGQLTLHITNPTALGFFELGQPYYLDFQLAPQ